MIEEILIEIPSGEKISAVAGKPKNAAPGDAGKTLILMVHGFPGQKNSHNDFFGDIERVLLEGGFYTVRFDFRGCGASDGHSDNFTLDSAGEDMRNILHWAKTQGFKRFGYVAEGLGASVALVNMPGDVAFMILAWPILNPSALFEFKGMQGIQSENPKTAKGGPETLSQDFLNSLKKFDTAQALEKVNVPILVLHGARDQQVPIDQLECVRRHFRGPRAEITTFEDGEHGLMDLAQRRMVAHHARLFAGRYSKCGVAENAQKT